MAYINLCPGFSAIVTDDSVNICFEGYVDSHGGNDLIVIERKSEDHRIIRVWSDPTTEEPTHVIDLSAAVTDTICGSCQTKWADAQLKPVKDLYQRVLPGEIFPSGECPECGALCHPIEARPSIRKAAGSYGDCRCSAAPEISTAAEGPGARPIGSCAD